MRKYDIAVIPGDGVGPEIMSETMKVLHTVEETIPGINLEFITVEAGANLYKKTVKERKE